MTLPCSRKVPWQALCFGEDCTVHDEPHDNSITLEHAMITEAITTTTPVLAAGWAFLYLLFGGGLGGAALIFFGLKLIGR